MNYSSFFLRLIIPESYKAHNPNAIEISLPKKIIRFLIDVIPVCGSVSFSLLVVGAVVVSVSSGATLLYVLAKDCNFDTMHPFEN